MLANLINIYCHKKHSPTLCGDCRDLLEYAGKRLKACPYDPKPKCKDCKSHCYAPDYRGKIREVMRFSGMYMVRRGRIDLLFKYFLLKCKRRNF